MAKLIDMTGRTCGCPQGHPYSGDNLYTHPTKGQRICRTCGRERAAQKREALRAQRKAA